MNKINYQRETDRIVARLEAEGRRERLLLHVCCAPCASYVLEFLTQHFDVTVFFSNPNIADPVEYQKRLDELYRFCAEAPFCRGVTVVPDDCPPARFFDAAAGLEDEPEGGARCDRCFRLRLSRTADYAQANGFPLFATTLTVSPHKDPVLINGIGADEAARCGVGYLPSDFKKRGGYQRSIVLSREHGLYRQDFCGCPFSQR